VFDQSVSARAKIRPCPSETGVIGERPSAKPFCPSRRPKWGISRAHIYELDFGHRPRRIHRRPVATELRRRPPRRLELGLAEQRLLLARPLPVTSAPARKRKAPMLTVKLAVMLVFLIVEIVGIALPREALVGATPGAAVSGNVPHLLNR
jgi:hypothetical protein